MGCPFGPGKFPSRRGLLGAAGGLLAAAGAARAASPDQLIAKGVNPAGQAQGRGDIIPFRGRHQAGIATPLQNHTFLAAFDIVSDKRADLVILLRKWTDAAERLSKGQTAEPLSPGLDHAAEDSGEAMGLAPARLTVTFGFGPGLFSRDGHDRFGLASHRPEALIDLPRFNGDQLVENRTGGDLSVQACADDPQVAFHAIRQLARLAYNIAEIRWTQTGFTANAAANDTPRNLMGFKDGTQNPAARPAAEDSGGAYTGSLDQVVWVGDDGPEWMRGGSYAVVRKIRMALEHWDRTDVAFQEEVIGRHKYSGAPIGKQSEFDALDLDRTDNDGNPIIAENAHVRLAAAETNDGAQILRRGYSYNDGTNITAERWPPWRQGMEYDAGLLFICYQRDPRTGFVKLFENMAKFDTLNQFTTHVGSGIFAVPRGVSPGEFIGQGLFG